MMAVKAWSELIHLPTYKTGQVDPNPLFLENRVYQGSSGAVYPYGVIDSIEDQPVDQAYQAIFLENEYIKVMFLPELGGRIHRAYDKIKQRDFVYYNEVIKPALVGLIGPWISGGIEFNWPQHHRPTTYMKIDSRIEHNLDDSITVWLGEIEPMHGLQVMTAFTLYKDKALIEIKGKIFNGNETPRRFLWWANPAITAGNGHQTIFPPDVTAVYDHGKRDVSDFPIATGTYYKINYAPGTDISRYKNIPVPTSYMADKSNYDFIGGYNHEEQGGLLHIANHHIVPGKKQWTWGNCDFGLAWDRNLTDHNGPYIEMMTGVFTDNQPDFTWLEANEQKEFVQNFLPYSELGIIHNANTNLALNLCHLSEDQIQFNIYAISILDRYHVTLFVTNAINNDSHARHQNNYQKIFEHTFSLTPTQVLSQTIDYASFEDKIISDIKHQRFMIKVESADKLSILTYIEHIDRTDPIPDPATPPDYPEKVTTIEELYFIGQHLEQYNHATRSALDYYQEALSRDPNDYRCNLAMATIEYNRANYQQALTYANKALIRAHHLNKNPICGRASFIRGAIYERLDDLDQSINNYFKSTWSGNCKDGGFYALARITMKQNKWIEALEYAERSLNFNQASVQCVTLKATLLLLLNRNQQAKSFIMQQQLLMPLSHGLAYLMTQLAPSDDNIVQFKQLCGDRAINAIQLSVLFLSFGLKNHALNVLELIGAQSSMGLYFKVYLNKEINKEEQHHLLKQAQLCFNQCIQFPNNLTEVAVLQYVIKSFPDHCDFAKYLLGCFYYAKKSYEDAAELWQQVIASSKDFAPAYRNLAVYFFNKKKEPEQALQMMTQAFKYAQQDARILFELDYLYKRQSTAPAERIERLKKHLTAVLKRDDLTAELLNLCHIVGDTEIVNNSDGVGHSENEKLADRLLNERIFHPWEGGEGKVTGQYLINKMRHSLQLIQRQEFRPALIVLQQALTYPVNLGEGRLVAQSDNDLYYLMGYCCQALSEPEQANKYFEQASLGASEISQSKYYNDQPADYLFYQGLSLYSLGNTDQAKQLFEQMIHWAETHNEDQVEPDFFAVSLPELIVFDMDLNCNHRIHCLFILMLGHLGLTKMGLTTNDEYKKIADQLRILVPDHSKNQLLSLFSQVIVPHCL